MMRVSARRLGAEIPKPPAGAGMLAKSKYWGHVGWEACRHIYHGFRLFGRNTKVAAKLTMRVRNGQSLTRRERLLLEKATVDLLRLVPFSFFILLPAGELLLPVAVKMFPGLIPSTFETKAQGMNRAFQQEMIKASARNKLTEYSTTQIVSASHGYHHEEVNKILRKLASADKITKDHISRLRPMFLTGGPLGYDKLSPEIITCLAKVCGIHKWYHQLAPNKYVVPRLSAGIEQHFKKLQSDDRAIEEEGLSMLTRDELEHANHQRGLRWVDDDAALVSQLQTWVDLSLDDETPYHMLFFIRPTYHSLQQSMRSLPQDTRQKLLEMMKHGLPIHVGENLSELVEKIDKHTESELEEDSTADELAEKVSAVETESCKVKTELDNQNARQEIARYLGRVGSFDRLYEDIVEEEKVEVVTVKVACEFLAQKTKLSTHIVSTLFDAMEFTDGKKALSKKKFSSLMARLQATDE